MRTGARQTVGERTESDTKKKNSNAQSVMMVKS